jgi:cytochrome c oxidase subunit 1
MIDATTKKLCLFHFWVAFGAFALACVFGEFQVLERSGLISFIQSPAVYFASVSTHGVLMAFVLTTFFIMGFGYYTATDSLKMPLWNPTLAWTSYGICLGGTVLAAIPLLLGKASVLYTFYPPVQANAFFYIGATLLVVGSWLWVVQMLMMLTQWKKANAGKTVPLPMFATATNAVLWSWTSVGVALEAVFQLLPWALGLVDTIDVGLARTLFSWTLHPIVYFWLIPAYIALYSYVPGAAGGKLFSDELARLAFLLILVFGLPIGFHHLYMDPEQNHGWKFLHMVGTFAVAIPTLLTGFTVIASLESAGRKAGGKGLFGWIGALPWRNTMVLASILSLLMLLLGGFGGIVNASYAMNAMVHNTAWVPGHFHLIFGGTVIIMYLALGYQLWPKITGKALFCEDMARVQLWMWFVGLAVMSTPWHVLGLLGQPRRISAVNYNSVLTLAWDPYELVMVAGGLVMLASGLMFAYNLYQTQVAGKPLKAADEGAQPETAPAVPDWLNGFTVWNGVILALMLVSYGIPIAQFFLMKTYNPTAWGY